MNMEGHRDYLSIFSWVRTAIVAKLVVIDVKATTDSFFPKRLTPIPRFLIVAEELALAESLNAKLRHEALIGYLHPKHLGLLKGYLGSAEVPAHPFLLVSDSIADSQRQLDSPYRTPGHNDSRGVPYYYYSADNTIPTAITAQVESEVEAFMKEVIGHNVAVCTEAGVFEIGKSSSNAFYIACLIIVLVVGLIGLVCICNKIRHEEKDYEATFKGNKKR